MLPRKIAGEHGTPRMTMGKNKTLMNPIYYYLPIVKLVTRSALKPASSLHVLLVNRYPLCSNSITKRWCVCKGTPQISGCPCPHLLGLPSSTISATAGLDVATACTRTHRPWRHGNKFLGFHHWFKIVCPLIALLGLNRWVATMLVTQKMIFYVVYLCIWIYIYNYIYEPIYTYT